MILEQTQPGDADINGAVDAFDLISVQNNFGNCRPWFGVRFGCAGTELDSDARRWRSRIGNVETPQNR